MNYIQWARRVLSEVHMAAHTKNICDCLWENQVQENGWQIFFSKDAPWIHFIHPKVQKIAPNVIKINSTGNSNIIPLFKLKKITFFPRFPRPTFQNVITHKIFEILWCPLHRIFCTWYRLIKHINIDIWKKWLWLGFSHRLSHLHWYSSGLSIP
jgi:hypothetical protein